MARLTMKDDKAPADTYYPMAAIAIEIGDDGEVKYIAVLPAEGDPGYFGAKLDERVWAAVQRHFDKVASEVEAGLLDDSEVIIGWEG